MQAEAMIRRCQTLLGDPHGDYHDMPKMLSHLNTSMFEIADRARYLHVPAYHPVRAGQAWYTLPANFLSVDLVFFRGQPYPLGRARFAEILPWAFDDGIAQGTPQCFDVFGNGVDERFIAQVAACLLYTSPSPRD